MNFIYKSPTYRKNITELLSFLFILLIIVLPTYTDGNWKISFLILLFVIVAGLLRQKQVFIYDEKLIIKRIFKKKEISFKNVSLFERVGGFGGGGYVLRYNEKKCEKQIGFYISKKQDVEMLIKFFISKGIKVTAQIPMI